jgi:site-specific recombinase XerD
MDTATAVHAFERYLQRRYPGRSTAKHYLSDLRQFQKMCAKPWAEVTSADIDAFADYGQDLGWKPATLARRVAAMKTFFEFWAVEANLLDIPNPVQPDRQAPKRGQRLPRDVPDAVLEQLWLALGQPRDQVWFTRMLRGGLRVSEVVALNRSEVLSPATDGQPARVRVIGKGCKERIIYLSVDAYAVVARWLALMPGLPSMPLCPNARGKRLTVNGLHDRLRQAAAKAGGRVTCHQLRHTYARHLVEHDLPVTTLSKLLGHECLSTTQVYLTGADPQVREAYTAAMTHWEQATPLGPTTSAVPPSARLVKRPAAPTSLSPAPVVGPAPSPPLSLASPKPGVSWAADLLEWVRTPCLEWVEQQARQWKPSYGQRHRQHRLRVLAQFPWHRPPGTRFVKSQVGR